MSSRASNTAVYDEPLASGTASSFLPPVPLPPPPALPRDSLADESEDDEDEVVIDITEQRRAAMLDMLSREPPSLYRPRRKRKRALDGGVPLNGTGPKRKRSVSSVQTDESMLSASTLPPVYNEYE